MFEREDTPTIMDGWVVRYSLRGGWNGEINASRNGLSISGRWPVMKHPAQKDEIIATLHKAEAHYLHLSGRDDPKPLDESELPT